MLSSKGRRGMGGGKGREGGMGLSEDAVVDSVSLW